MDGAEATRIIYGQGSVMSKSRLKAVNPEEAKSGKAKILIYGKPGVGKTFTSLDFPSCYFIDTEGGASRKQYMQKLTDSGGVYYGIDQGSLEFSNVIEQFKALATEKHNYKTVVLDSISKIANNEIAREMERLGDKDVYGASKKPSVSKTRQLIDWIHRIDMNVIMTAHEKVLWGLVNGERAEIGVTFDGYDKLEHEFDLSLNIIKLPTKRNAVIRKTRLEGFVDGTTFEWSYKEFAQRYGREIIEKEAGQLQLASPEQVVEIKYLQGIVRLPEGFVEKCLTAANTSCWEDMDADKLQKTINHIKEKFIPKNEVK